MTYELNGKRYTIPNEELDKLQTKLKISKSDAVDVWLVDHELEVNEEQELLNKTAAAVERKKESSGKRKQTKPRTVKISGEKQWLFTHIFGELSQNFDSVTVLKENKLIEVKINDKIFKIDVIEQRKPKN